MVVLAVLPFFSGCGFAPIGPGFGSEQPQELVGQSVLDSLIGQDKQSILFSLGRPEATLYSENASFFIYGAQGEQYQIGVTGFPPFPLVDVVPGDLYCVLLEFDEENIFHSYRMKHRWLGDNQRVPYDCAFPFFTQEELGTFTGRHFYPKLTREESEESQKLNENTEDLKLRELGEQGDSLAQDRWEKSRTYYLSQNMDIVDERNEDEKEYIREKYDLSIDLKKRAVSGDSEAQFELYMLEDKIPMKWLCRSADQGYMKAEMWLGYLYETGSYGCPRDYFRSYLWYRRAAIGEHQKEVDKLVKKIEKKKPVLYFCKGISCEIARNIVSLEGMLSAEGISIAESMLEQWKPGQCEQELAGAGQPAEIK